MPHPSEPKINIRVQTRPGESANEALKIALQQLADISEHIGMEYSAALATFDAAGGNVDTAIPSADVIPADAVLADTSSKKKTKRKSGAVA
jgi:hypothetical protein